MSLDAANLFHNADPQWTGIRRSRNHATTSRRTHCRSDVALARDQGAPFCGTGLSSRHRRPKADPTHVVHPARDIASIHADASGCSGIRATTDTRHATTNTRPNAGAARPLGIDTRDPRLPNGPARTPLRPGTPARASPRPAIFQSMDVPPPRNGPPLLAARRTQTPRVDPAAAVPAAQHGPARRGGRQLCARLCVRLHRGTGGAAEAVEVGRVDGARRSAGRGGFREGRQGRGGEDMEAMNSRCLWLSCFLWLYKTR